MPDLLLFLVLQNGVSDDFDYVECSK